VFQTVRMFYGFVTLLALAVLRGNQRRLSGGISCIWVKTCPNSFVLELCLQSNQPHTFVVITLDPPIRKGQTFYPHIVLQVRCPSRALE
jgi:hypothetical protein